MSETTTLSIDGAELTVATAALFHAWFERHLDASLPARLNPIKPSLAIPDARPGERYITSIMEPDGRMRHVFLLPGEARENWDDGMAWAKEQGGELPDRIVFAFLKTYMQGEFQKEAYWMNEQHAGSSYYAWYQSVRNGLQSNSHKDHKLLVRAVRSEYSVIQ